MIEEYVCREEKMQSSLFPFYFLLSFTINIYMGLSNYLKSTYTPNEQDLEILGEMTKMVNDSE